MVFEVANILWKKVRRHGMSAEDAVIAARLLQKLDIEIVPTLYVVDIATELALNLNHPAYDCIYLALGNQEFASVHHRGRGPRA